MASSFLLVGLFFTLPMDGVRIAESLALSDAFLLSLLPVLGVRLLLHYELTAPPKWFFLGSATLLLSVFAHEFIRFDETDEILERFGAFQPESNIRLGLTLFLAVSIFPLMSALSVESQGVWTRSALAFVGGAALSAAVAFSDAFLGTTLFQTFAHDSDRATQWVSPLAPRYGGLSAHPTSLALICAMAIPIALSLAKTKAQIIIAIAVIPLFAAGIIASGGRAGGLMGIFGLLAVVVLSRRLRDTLASAGRLVVSVMVVAALVVTVTLVQIGPGGLGGSRFPGGSDSSARIFDSTSTNRSDRERWEELTFAVEESYRSPLLGFGYELIRKPHNSPVQLTLAGGLIALVGWSILMVGYILTAWGLSRRVGVQQEALALGLLVSLLVMIGAGMVGNHLPERFLYAPAALILMGWFLFAGKEGHLHPLFQARRPEPGTR